MPRTYLPWLGATLAASAFLVNPRPAHAWWQYGGPLYQRSFPDMPPPSSFGYNLEDQHPGYYGGSRYREYYSFGRGALMADFPIPLPSYYGPGRYHRPPPPGALPPPGPPLPLAGDPTAAHLEVRVPADAEVWLEGMKTHQTGALRLFASPPLVTDQDYVYEIKAKWSEDARPIEQSRSVTVRAGQRLRVDFLSSEGDMLPAPKAVAPGKEK